MYTKIITATTHNNGIGYNNTIPWYYKNDLIFFKNITKGNHNNAILMGHNTFLSLPNSKPLPDRLNIILTKKNNINHNYNNLYFCNNIQTVYDICYKHNIDILFVIGGEQIYNLFINNYSDKLSEIIITNIPHIYKTNKFFPNINYNIWNKYKSQNIDTQNNIIVDFYKKI